MTTPRGGRWRPDPEVAALLDDLPPPRLPDELVKRDWGQVSMARAQAHGNGTLKDPATVFQPTYDEHCYQCGRPITKARRDEWSDHACETGCDGALVDSKLVHYHFPKSELDIIQAYVDRQKRIDTAYYEGLFREEKERQKQWAKDQAARKLAPCGASRHGHGCQHQCSQHGDHFGFHECKFCKHLWK